ncbi:MAG: metallophosphoesterase family protein [Bacteroidia bacterium]|nr:metallophosphoesterase family protein [Bacteroidia bacterium]
MRKIVISDIHGCLKSFKALLEHQVVLEKRDELYLLGDYIDRGPDSKGVIDHIIALKEAGYKVHALKGNHEEMMAKAVRQNDDTSMWLYNGGHQSLESFGLRDPKEIPEKYLKFIDELDNFFEVDEYILVHAGLNFTGNSSEEEGDDFLWRMHNPLSDLKSMMWIRWWYEDINWSWLKDRIIVHGHTPVDIDDIWDMVELLSEDQVLDIDNGCFAKYNAGMGRLCAFDLVNRDLYFQENIEGKST